MEPHLVDRLWPDPASGISLDEALAGFEPPPPVDGRPGVAVNMVTSIDGRAQQPDGTAEGLGSRVDRILMRHYRSAFDAVMSGSGTLLSTGVWLRVGDEVAARRVAEGREPNPIGVVVAGSTAIPTSARWFSGDERRILVVGADNPIRDVPEGTELLRAPDARPAPSWVLQCLGERGVGTVLLEGGPHLNAAFFSERLVDEVYWTVGAQVLGSAALPMIAASPFEAGPIRARLLAVVRHGDELMLRYALEHRA